MDKFDVIVIGAGPGGYVAAIKATQENLKVAIVEKGNVGGVCLNIGCIPTKALLKSAKVLHYCQTASEYGLDISGKYLVSPNWINMQKRKDEVVKKLTSGVDMLLKKNKITKIQGQAKALDAKTVEVNGIKYQCDNLIIATGSFSRNLPLEGFKEAKDQGFLITSRQALSLPQIPKQLVIIGGGVIGVEFACLYSTLGCEVIILQNIGTILEMLDTDVSQEITKILTKNNIRIETNVEIQNIKNKTITYKKEGKSFSLSPDYVLISVGRQPIIEGFENIGLEIGERGNIVTNEKCETNIAHVYAIGDVTADKMLAHVASAQGIVVIENILGKNEIFNAERVPGCIYTFPEVAVIGLTEQECIKQKLDYKVFKYPLMASGKAIADGETQGFVKLIAQQPYSKIIGAHIIASTATDMISEITTVMELEGTVHELAKSIHPHPTLSEVIMEAAHGVLSKPINF